MPHAPSTLDPTADDLTAAAEVIDLSEGPWKSAFAVWIPGRVRSKSNYRHDKKTAWSELTDYDEAVYLAARAHLPSTWQQPVDASLPASLRGLGAYSAVEPEGSANEVMPVVVHLTARTLLDTGNVSKSVLDALEGLLYANDAHVAAASEHVVRVKTGQGLLAAFAQLDPTSRFAAVTHAHLALQAAVSTRLVERLHPDQIHHRPDDCAAAGDAHPAPATAGTPATHSPRSAAPTTEELIRA